MSYSAATVFPGDGEMSRRMRGLDWSMTDLGAPDQWPANLRMVVPLCLGSPCPTLIWWGSARSVLYNDACIPLLGRADAELLGRSGLRCASELCDRIRPRLDCVLATGSPGSVADIPLHVERVLPLEEVYVTFSCTPVPGDDGRGVAGVFCAGTETTQAVVARRRLETLRRLSTTVCAARGVAAGCRHTAAVFRENPHDIPFAALYVVDETGTHAALGCAVLPRGEHRLPDSVSLTDTATADWPVVAVLRTQRSWEVDLEGAGRELSGELWPDRIRTALVHPMRGHGRRVAGVLVAGIGPRRVLDDEYRAFVELLAERVGHALADSQAHDEERRRAVAVHAALAEASADPSAAPARQLDRAPARKPRILSAAHQPDMRAYVQHLLEPQYQVQQVCNGELALRAALANPPDLVLSDVMLPGADGPELLRQLRSNPRTRGVPVILLSATPDDVPPGADDCLVKPFSARGLLARIGLQLELARVRRDAEQRVTRILECISDAFHLIDADWRISYMNAAARTVCSAHGLDPESMIGKHVFDELFPDLRETELGRRLRRAMADSVPATFETYYAPWDEWYAGHLDPLSDGGLACYYREITEQKKAEEVQRRLQRERDEALTRLQLQFERMTIACLVMDTAFRIIDWNPAAAALFGYSLAEAVGHDGPQLLVPPAGRERITQLLRRLSDGDMNAHSVNENVTKDGRTIICDWHNTPLRAPNGEFIGVLSMAQDVTDRTRAEEALHASEERFRLVTEALAGCVYDWRASTNRIQFFGDTATILGWRPDEIPHDPQWWKARIHPADRPTGLYASQNAALGGVTGWSVEYRIQHRDGRFVDVAEGARIIRGADGSVLRVVGGMRDVSERRNLEREREYLLERERSARAAAETAAAALREAEHALAQRAAELERSNADLAQFASIASHDLQEPLRTVASFVRLLADRYGNQLDERAGRWIDFTLHGVDRMQRLVAGLLALAHVRSDNVLVPTDTTAAVARTWENLCSGRSVRDAQLTHGDLPVVIADATQIELLFQNLLGNAIKYRRPEMRLTVHVAAERHVSDAGADWEFTVRDNGIGLDTADAGRIFEIFQRLHRDDSYEGTGIGLAICRKIVERHGGRIWVTSAPGAGATFHFTIPERSS